MTTLAELPQDVIYHLLSFLSVQQSLALSRTCHTLHHLAQSDKSYWFTALQSSRFQGHTTAYLAAVDLSAESDLATLHRHVQNCLKFERLWTKDKLTPTHTVTGRLPDVLYCLFGVHRTNFVVMHSPHSGYVYCWDNTTGETREAIYLGTQITDTSPLNEFPDRVTIALLIQEGTRQHIKLLSVSTEEDATQVMELRHIVDLGVGTRSFNIFLSEQMVGVTGNENDRITIHAVNIHTGASSTIRTDVQLTPTSYMVAMTFNDAVYLVDMNPPQTRVFCCERDYLPYANAPTRTLHQSLLDTRRDFLCDDLDQETNDYYCALVSGAGRGVAFTTLTQLVGRHALHIVLWDPRSREGGGEVPREARAQSYPPESNTQDAATSDNSLGIPATSSGASESTSQSSASTMVPQPESPNLPYDPPASDRPFPSPAQHISIPGSMLVPLGPWYLVHFPNSGRHLLLAVGKNDEDAEMENADGHGEDEGGSGTDEDADDSGEDDGEMDVDDDEDDASEEEGELSDDAMDESSESESEDEDQNAAGVAGAGNGIMNGGDQIPALDQHIALINGGETRDAVLYLVHYVPETASHSVHEVPFPPNVDPRSVTSLSFDDYNAVVTLTTLEDVAYCMHLI
ncbi:hypothetical protein HDZ31DRAFT_63704 [Schizophyllum fasciatum]